MIIPTYFLSLIAILFSSGQIKITADLHVFNAHIFTLSPNNSPAESMVIGNGKILFLGTKAEADLKYSAIEKIDMLGKSIYPGFIDGHCHFYGYGEQFKRVNLTGTKSWNEVVSAVKEFGSKQPTGWIQGRGWDQNDWLQKYFPTNELLNLAFPSQPVFIKRIDGHAAVANDAALKLAGFTTATKISGGEFKIYNGKLTGVLIDNAMDSLEKFIPRASSHDIAESLLAAQKKCFEVGLTTVSDAGLDKYVIDIIDSLQKNNLLKMRIYAMLADNPINKQYYFKHGPYITEKLKVTSFKFYIDGALGSRGALMKKSYTDESGNFGIQLNSTEYFSRKFAECLATGFQVCAHAIGDSANKLVLDLYGKNLIGKNNKRWRIEHAQIVSIDDRKLFNSFSIIPSIQPCFTTSDMYWATDRIGQERIKSAYSWKSLLQQTGIVTCGSDFPVEDINPLFGFYAAVTRMDQKLFPVGGFIPEEKLSRIEALKGMTIWAAYANFMENEIGSLTVGKFADFVVLDNEIMTIDENELFKVKVLMTYSNGELVYKK